MDTDTELTLVEVTNYKYALNIRNGYGSIIGTVTPVKGNELVSYPLPAGNNTCIGTAEDDRNKKVLYFVYNDADDHLILSFDPATNTIERLAQGSVFNFKKEWKVNHAVLIDSKLLYWTDAYTEGESIEGNPPRKINIEKSNVTTRSLEYEVHTDDALTFLDTVPPSGITLNFRDVTTSQSQLINTASLTAFQGDPEGFLEFVKGVIEFFFSNWVESVEFCECKLVIKTTTLNGETVEFYMSSADPIEQDVLVVPIDHYPITIAGGNITYLLEEQHISLIKKPPRCEPTTEFFKNPTFAKNLVIRDIFQFRTRYWYDDYEKSAWSAISLLALPLDNFGVFLESLNTIRVNFSEDILADTSWRNVLKRVELAVRIGNDSNFRTVEEIEICDIGIKQNLFNFLNDQTYPIVSSDDIVINQQLQTIKNFDNVPKLSSSLEFVANREGQGRLFMGGNLENYDIPDCVDISATLNPQYVDVCDITIKGTIEIDVSLVPPNMDVNDNENSAAISFLDDGVTYIVGVDTTISGGGYIRIPYGMDEPNMLNGFVVYLAGTGYKGISKNFTSVVQAERDGSFEIKNVPQGRYIMRVASWKVNTGNNQGIIFNINNGIEWQKTSSPVVDCAGSLAATGIATERVIDLTGFTTNVLDLDTTPGYGPIIIMHRMTVPYYLQWPFPGLPVPAGTNYVAFINGYLLDNSAQSSTNAERKAGVGVERQKINIDILEDNANPTLFTNVHMITDHNGYFFHKYLYLGDPLVAISRVGWAKNFFPTIPDTPLGLPIQFRNLSTFTNIFNGVLRLWGFEDLYKDQETLYSYFAGAIEGGMWGNPSPSGNREAPMLHNDDTLFYTNNRTQLQGQIVDLNNQGIDNVYLVMERNGRVPSIDENGTTTFNAWCPWDNVRRIDDQVFIGYLSDICFDFPPSSPPVPPGVPLTPFVADYSNPYVYDSIYVMTTTIFPIQGSITNQTRYLKAAGTYRLGIVYEDEYNRQSTVGEGKSLRIPYFTETGLYKRSYVIWEIDSQPPIWANHFRIVRTKDSVHQRYSTFKIVEVIYAIFTSVDVAFTLTDFPSANASHLMFQIPSSLNVGNTETNEAIWFYKGQTDTDFSPQIKDRLRFILDASEHVLFAPKGMIDVEIQGIYFDVDGNQYLIIENIEIFSLLYISIEIKKDWLVELYTPKTIEDTIFYECGECLEIIDPGTANRRHKGTEQDQIIGIQPATGLFKGGDTYWRTTQYAIKSTAVALVENQHIVSKFDSNYDDIGRVNIKDIDFGERFYSNKISYSDIYVPKSKANGLSSFIGSDKQDVDIRFGIIKNLSFVGDVLLAICEFKIQPFYVGKDNVLSLSGRNQIGRSDRTMNAANELVENFGTQHPSSISHDGNYCYGFDARQGVAWRYATNGLEEISKYKMIQEFNAIGKEFNALSPKNNDILGIFDREFKCYLLTFPAIPGRDATTISFDELKNGWNTYLSYIPEYFGITGQVLVTFKDGALWVHESDTSPFSNFYGVQTANEVDIVFNRYPKATKLFFNIEQQSDKLFACPSITIPANNPYATGMESELLANKFFNYEGHWNADFLRDKNDTSKVFRDILDPTQREITAMLQGRNLRGEVMVVKLSLSDLGQFFNLKRIDVGFSMSEETKK